MRTAELKIHTPEGIEFSQLLAGPVTRLHAWMLDFFCVLVIVLLLRRVASLLAFLSPGIAAAFLTLAYFIVSIGYSIACEWPGAVKPLAKNCSACACSMPKACGFSS